VLAALRKKDSSLPARAVDLAEEIEDIIDKNEYFEIRRRGRDGDTRKTRDDP